MAARFERFLAASPADETDLAWIEVRRGEAAVRGRDREPPPARELTVVVRVRERGRCGTHRMGAGEASDLDRAVRQALARARLDPQPEWPEPSTSAIPPAAPPAVQSAAQSAVQPAARLHDPETAALTGGAARVLLARLVDRGESARLCWAEGQVILFDSRGGRAQAQATAVSLDASCGRHPGAGWAAGSSRGLGGLRAEEIVDRARRRSAASGPGEPAPPAELPPGPLPLVLSPEAVADLVDLWNRSALTASAAAEPGSWLRAHLGGRAVDAALSLRDDGTDPAGLSFPFDLAGRPKALVDLVVAGVLRSPAVDARLAAELGLAPTPHRLGEDEVRAANLFLLPGGATEVDLLAAAEGGLWVSRLERLTCYDATTLAFRGGARGVRRIEDGGLGRAVADLSWESRLASALGDLRGVGSHTVCRATGGGLLESVVAPALALGPVSGLSPSRAGAIP